MQLEGEKQSHLQSALSELESGSDVPYYDEAADTEAREIYYGSIEEPSATLLSELLERTHTSRPSYSPLSRLYPWIDLHPDRLIRSIYSGKDFEPEELIRADAEIEAARTERLHRLVRREMALGPEALAAELDSLDDALPYNCEHVVPQSWFGKDEPMRGDLHHLFACESGCNSFRGNSAYFDFEDREEVVRSDCGRSESDSGFEPGAGKGPVARATLYFLLRYPQAIGDTAPELKAERLPLLLQWHERDPVSEYEAHRNAAIAAVQGNRNPLIDNPEWATEVEFAELWARMP